MAHTAGSALYAHLVWSGGTAVLTGDQKSFNWDQAQNFADTTAGSDDGESAVKTTSNATGSFEWLDNGTSEAYGTIVYEGQYGTLVWGQLGTATGAPKFSCAAWIENVSVTAQFDDAIAKSASWRKDGDWIENYFRAADTW